MLRFRLSLLELIVRTAIDSEEDFSFLSALDFIMNNEEMFEKLTYVYNTSEKMIGVCKRIKECYESVGDSKIADDVSDKLYASLQEFVASKKTPIPSKSPEDKTIYEDGDDDEEDEDDGLFDDDNDSDDN